MGFDAGPLPTEHRPCYSDTGSFAAVGVAWANVCTGRSAALLVTEQQRPDSAEGFS